MRLAAIADIHGNLPALQAVLDDIAGLGIAEIVNLGDHVSEPLEARRTAELIMARGFPSIRGDQDRRLVELARLGGSARRDLAELGRRHLEWLGGLPTTMTWGGEVFLCHGSPRSDSAYWLDRVSPDGAVRASTSEEVEAETAGIGASLILCAHTHIPRAVRLRDGRLVVNPGSVGCPGYIGTDPVRHVVQTGTPDAVYAILERTERGWSATFRHVPYDNAQMAEMARRNGMPEWAAALATGWVA